MSTDSSWNPLSPDDWGAALGLVPVPMFGAAAIHAPAGSHSVLLDGQRASFAMSAMDSDAPLSWSWSSNLRHMMSVDRNRGQLTIRRWDNPTETFSAPLPSTRDNAREILARMEHVDGPRTVNVIEHVLRAFRRLRERVPGDAVDAIRILNALLVGAERVRVGQITERDWSHITSVQNVLDVLDSPLLKMSGADLLLGDTRNVMLADLAANLVAPLPDTGCSLAPDLLLRHAASHLYQEAHIEIERHPQPYLPGLERDDPPDGVPTRKDVRFTPPTLARMLAQRALDATLEAGSNPNGLRILDPACGSGVFLQEILRELCRRDYRGHVSLIGFDTSPISRLISQFCLARAAQDASLYGINAEVSICQQDALSETWGSSDIVLMNPPFVGWNEMRSSERELTRDILGPLGTGKPDMATAFLWKATSSLRPGGVLASVLPSALLETTSGEKLRRALSDAMAPTLIGRFEGSSYFRGATVETAFVTLRFNSDTSAAPPSTCMVLAREGSEDAALRALRMGSGATTPHDGAWEITQIPSGSFSPRSWLPRSRRSLHLQKHGQAIGLMRVRDLFQVKQGVRVGNRGVFVMPSEELKELPASEQKFFRPIADTIKAGRIHTSGWLFHPYGADGIILDTEENLREYVPTFYAQRLMPKKQALAGRQRVGDRWWKLAEPRSWQYEPNPKLVSTYFGDRGSFAFDCRGDFVVVQGMAWLWRRESTTRQTDLLPWAYLALLNSNVFEKMISLISPRVQGGQYNLSAKFVGDVFLPNLDDPRLLNEGVTTQLAMLGHRIHEAGLNTEIQESLTSASLRAYGDMGAVMDIDTQLGTAPWTDLARLILDMLNSGALSELTMPTVAELARQNGYRWQDAQLVVEKLTIGESHALERIFVRGTGDRAAIIADDQVKEWLRNINENPAGVPDWRQWAQDIRVVWRRPKP